MMEHETRSVAERLHDAYVYGANQVGWEMERVDFEEMDPENQAMMEAMAERLRENDDVTVGVSDDE